jgi:hypothetical protein
VTFTFEEVPLNTLQDKPKQRQPSERQMRIQREIESVQATIRNAKTEKKAYRVNLGDMKQATFRLRFAAARKALGRGYEKINLVMRNGELFVGPVEPSRRGGRRRSSQQ